MARNKDHEGLYYLGYVSKTRGFKGEVSIYLDVDDPNDYSALESVFVEIQQEPVPFFIDKIQLTRKQFANVKFEGVDSDEDAMRMVKKNLFLPLELLPPLEGKHFYFHEVQGFKVMDVHHGEIGTIKEVLEYPNNPLFQVMQGYQEILVPMHDEVLLEVNREERFIKVEMPEGLLEIYLGKSDDEDDYDGE